MENNTYECFNDNKKILKDAPNKEAIFEFIKKYCSPDEKHLIVQTSFSFDDLFPNNYRFKEYSLILKDFDNEIRSEVSKYLKQFNKTFDEAIVEMSYSEPDTECYQRHGTLNVNVYIKETQEDFETRLMKESEVWFKHLKEEKEAKKTKEEQELELYNKLHKKYGRSK